MNEHGHGHGHPPISHIWGSDEPLVTRCRQVVAHPSTVKLVKYAGVSAISTAVSQVTLLLTFGVFHVMSEVPANLVANVVATIPSYTLNRSWVWKKSDRSHFWREVVPFWVLSFIGLAFSSLAVYLAGVFARHHGLHHAGTALLVNAANLFAFGILWIVKFVIYNKLFHVDPIEIDEEHAEMLVHEASLHELGHHEHGHHEHGHHEHSHQGHGHDGTPVA